MAHTENESLLAPLIDRSARCAPELSSILGEDQAWTLIDGAVCEAFGWLLDRSAPEAAPPAEEGRGPAAAASRAELLDFFHRFWWMAEITLERGVGDYTGLEIDKLHEVQGRLCASLVRQYPTTVGRFGRETLARDWRAIVQELPRIWEAQTQLEVNSKAALSLSAFTEDVREILRPLDTRAPGIEALFCLRDEARARLKEERGRPVPRPRGRSGR